MNEGEKSMVRVPFKLNVSYYLNVITNVVDFQLSFIFFYFSKIQNKRVGL